MKNLRNMAWALALALLLAGMAAAQDKGNGGVVGSEVFSTSTPGGGGTLESQGLSGERTPWSITHAAPSLPGVVNVVVTYYDSQESRDKAKEKDKDKKKKDEKKKDKKESEGPSVPTYDPRFYDYKDGKLVPKDGNSSGSRTESNRQTASIDGLVAPDTVYSGQPFSFAVTQSTGNPVNIRSVDGVVVQQASTDKYGRVFLAAGLPAGAYLISLASHSQPIGKLEIKQRTGDALQYASQPIQVQNPPEALKVSERFSLGGRGFSPNFADMQVSLASSGRTETPMILAATEDQLKLAPVQQLQPGAAQLRVTNQATAETTAPEKLLLYDLHAELVRQAIHSGGDETRLVIHTEPPNLPLTVKTNVASGPVDFGGGRKEAEAVTNDGEADFPVRSERGTGPFKLTWQVADRQDFIKNDDCRCNVNVGRCSPEPDYICIERKIQNRWACISSHK